MHRRSAAALLAILVCAVLFGGSVAEASCTLPNTLTNVSLPMPLR
jgi:hypothetical protein